MQHRRRETFRPKQGDVLMVEFTVMGFPGPRLNARPEFTHSVIIFHSCSNHRQAETDRYWNAIVGNGGEELSAAGARTWGLSLQIYADCFDRTGPIPIRCRNGLLSDDGDERSTSAQSTRLVAGEITKNRVRSTYLVIEGDRPFYLGSLLEDRERPCFPEPRQ